MWKKQLAVLMTFCLLGQNIALAESGPRQRSSIKEIQAQLKADFAVLRSQYSNKIDKIVPAVLASAPLVSAMSREQLEAEINALRAEIKKDEAFFRRLQKEFMEAYFSSTAGETYIQYIIQEGEKGYIDNYFPYNTNRKLVRTSEGEVFAATKGAEYAAGARIYGTPVYLEQLNQHGKLNIKAANIEFLKTAQMYPSILLSQQYTTTRSEVLAKEMLELLSKDLPDDVLSMSVGGFLQGSVEAEFGVANAGYLNNLARSFVYTQKHVDSPSSVAVIRLMTLRKMLLNTEVPQARALAVSLGKRVIEKSGLGGLGLLMLGAFLLNSNTVSAQEISLAQRIVARPELLARANEQELAEIEASELAGNTAREVAAVIHTAAHELSPQVMEALTQEYEHSTRAEKLQKQEAERSLVHSLRPVKAR